MRELEDRIRGIAATFPGKLTLALTDLTTGDHLAINENEPIPAASVIKLPLLIALYEAAEARRVDLNDRLRYDERHRSSGTGVLTDLRCGIEISIRDAAVLMIFRQLRVQYDCRHHRRR
jgi:beta-lactamase class A